MTHGPKAQRPNLPSLHQAIRRTSSSRELGFRLDSGGSEGTGPGPGIFQFAHLRCRLVHGSAGNPSSRENATGPFQHSGRALLRCTCTAAHVCPCAADKGFDHWGNCSALMRSLTLTWLACMPVLGLECWSFLGLEPWGFHFLKNWRGMACAVDQSFRSRARHNQCGPTCATAFAEKGNFTK